MEAINLTLRRTGWFGIIASVLVLLLVSNHFVSARENKGQAKAPKERAKVISAVSKAISGEVSAVDKRGIAVVYGRNSARGEESEIYIPLDQDKIQMVHKRSLEEIQVGDFVKVEYAVVTEESQGRKGDRFQVKTITFVKPGQKKTVASESAPETEEPEEEIGEEPLILKGAR